MSDVLHIGEAARHLNVTLEHLRTLEREGRIPPVKCDLNGRIYSELDLALLRAMGVGRRPRRLRRLDELLRTTP